MKNKKDLIMSYLLDDGLSSTSKISSVIKSNHNDTVKFLEELLKEKKIVMLKTPIANYWDVKDSKLPYERSTMKMMSKIKKVIRDDKRQNKT